MTIQHSFDFSPRTRPSRRPRKNIVIEAGAGTGKTTAIVAEVLKLMLEDETLSPERIVLMTFTEKAAGEIADRIHAALAQLESAFDSARVVWPLDSDRPPFEVRKEDIESYRRACSVQLSRIHLLRSQTIHSFCQSILRQFPIEAQLDPHFRIIEGFDRSLFLGQSYDAWLDRETRTAATDQTLAEWEVMIAYAGYFFRIREMIFRLIERRDLLAEPNLDLGDISLVEPSIRLALRQIPPPGRGLSKKGARAEPTAANPEHLQRYVHSTSPPRAGAPIDAWIEYFAPIATLIETISLHDVDRDFKEGLKILRAGTKGDSIHERLVSHRAALALREMATRFIAFLDMEKRKAGVLDFDDLLLRTAEVLENDDVLDRVRKQYDFIFIDEFQDTDRVQARIIDRIARDASGEYNPGKTIVVGDPKQSIYGFRRADPETYYRMTQALESAGADRRQLEDQYRSDRPLLDAINGMAARLFVEPGTHDRNVFRPGYRPLTACRRGLSRELDARVTLLHVPQVDWNERLTAEAEAIAAWIAAHREGGDGDLRRFALLFRRMTRIDDYLDVFERHGIDYVLPPARLFLDRRAPVDLLAVLRAIAWPFDRGAQISAARSPYFALTDAEIAAGLLEGAPEENIASEPWRAFHASMGRFREAASQTTISGLIDLVVEETGIESVYEATADATRSLRHLDHVRAIAFDYDRKLGGSVRQFVTEIDRRRGDPDEAEPLLVDDTRNAIRILTVHGAKGLEFDTVIVPDLGFVSPNINDPGAVFTVEEPRSLVFCQPDSLSAHFRTTSDGNRLKDVAAERDKAEVRRLFYVAMTRAISDVVFVCLEGETKKAASFGACVNEALDIELKNIAWSDGREIRETAAGPVAFEKLPLRETGPARRRKLNDPDLESALRDGDLVPAAVAPGPDVVRYTPGEARKLRSAAANREIGILLHRFLEVWDGGATGFSPSHEGLKAVGPLAKAVTVEAGAAHSTAAELEKRALAVVRSDVYARIAAAETVAREMPVMFLDGSGSLVTRRVDRLIRENGRLIVVDYKSGDAKPEDRAQVAAYCRAIESIAGEACGGMIWYLESGEVVEVLSAEC